MPRRSLPGVVRYHVKAVDVGSCWNVLGMQPRASAGTAEAFLAEVRGRIPFPVRAVQAMGAASS
jgi:hypothetical protein